VSLSVGNSSIEGSEGSSLLMIGEPEVANSTKAVVSVPFFLLFTSFFFLSLTGSKRGNSIVGGDFSTGLLPTEENTLNNSFPLDLIDSVSISSTLTVLIFGF